MDLKKLKELKEINCLKVFHETGDGLYSQKEYDEISATYPITIIHSENSIWFRLARDRKGCGIEDIISTVQQMIRRDQSSPNSEDAIRYLSLALDKLSVMDRD